MNKMHGSSTSICIRPHELYNCGTFVFQTKIVSVQQPYEVLSI
jgi:hypothetical protein